MQISVAAWQYWKILERTLGRLEDAGELTPRRARTAARALWSTAHEIGRTHLPEAAALAKLVYKLDPAFVPHEGKLLRWLYACCGYATTQRLLRLRRAVIWSTKLAVSYTHLT